MRRVVTSALLIALSYASVAKAAIINLSGSLELSYSWSRDEQANKVIKEVSDFQQRYSLRNFGDLLDPRLGTFTVNGTFLHQDLQTRGESVDSQKLYNNLRLLDYSASVNLLPRLWPLTFTVQQLTQYNGSGSCYFFCSSGSTRKDRTTNYNINWVIPINHLPTVRLNLSQTELKSNEALFAANPINPASPTNITTKFANVEISDRFNGFNVVTRYQFSQTEFEGRDTTSANAVNLNLDGRITPALSLSASGNYTNQGGLNTSQVSFIQERGGRFALFYRPSSLWDGNISYDLSESPSGTLDFKRHLAQGSLNLRPTTQVDIFSSYRFMRFDIGPSLTDSHFGTAGFNWRPVSLFGLNTFGLLTGLSLTYGQTDVSGTGTASTTNTTFQNYRYSISYTRGLDRFRLSTGYSVSFGANRTVPVQTGSTPTHRDLLNTANVAFENTDVRLVHWLVSYAFTDTHRNGDTVQPQDDQRAHVVQVSADSSFFRNLFIQASASYTNIEGFGTQGRTIQLNTRATYFFWQGLSLTGEWNHQDFPGGFFGDSDIFTGEAQWVRALWQRTTVLFNVKEIYQNNYSTNDRQTIQGRSQLMYQLGKLVLTVDYLFVRDEGIHTAAPLNSQNFFVRAIRSF